MDEINKIKKITSIISDDLIAFENELENCINKSNNFLTNDLKSFMFSNPKRLRPIFIILLSKILNIKDKKTIQNISLITEILHNASLIHDDIIDNEKLRRNNPTFYDKYGAKIAVLEGDLLLSLALNILSKTNLEILKIFSDKIQKTLEGEIEQNASLNKITDEKTYYKKTFNKTGNLFLAGVESLFTLKKTEQNTKDNLINFIKNYTIAFQIKNDINNIKNKNLSDFKNGNYTLPVIYFCKEYDINILDCKDQCFQKCLNKAINETDNFKKNAISFLNKIEDTPYKKALIDLCNHTLRSEF